jgi:hypothetical protein
MKLLVMISLSVMLASCASVSERQPLSEHQPEIFWDIERH